MADRLYLSLWYANFRLEALPGALAAVLRQFAVVGNKRPTASTAYPINFTEPPSYQRLYLKSGGGTEDLPSNPAAPEEVDEAIEAAVAEATEQLHDDMAYEFEMRWQLWSLEPPDTTSGRFGSLTDEDAEVEPEEAASETNWKLRQHVVRILGFGPQFDTAGYEQNGHILIDFGLDTPWVLDDDSNEGQLDKSAQLHIQQNIEKLLALTLLIEKNCGISSRLLWTESGEPLAQKLIARLQRVN